jgi:hypothetical protein
MSWLDQRSLANGLGTRWPQVDLDKDLLIVALAELIPVENLMNKRRVSLVTDRPDRAGNPRALSRSARKVHLRQDSTQPKWRG